MGKVQTLRVKQGSKKYKLPEALVKKYAKGDGVNLKKVHTKIHKKKIEEKEKQIKFAAEVAAQTEVH